MKTILRIVEFLGKLLCAFTLILFFRLVILGADYIYLATQSHIETAEVTGYRNWDWLPNVYAPKNQYYTNFELKGGEQRHGYPRFGGSSYPFYNHPPYKKGDKINVLVREKSDSHQFRTELFTTQLLVDFLLRVSTPVMLFICGALIRKHSKLLSAYY